MDDDEIIAGYVKHVDRVPVFPPPTSRKDLAAAISAINAASKNDEYFWAWEAITELLDDDPERAWRLLLSALAQCAPEHEYIIGAGPLEELLIQHPRRFAERVANEVMQNPRFREAFGVINFSTEYTTVEESNYFTETLRTRGVPSELIPPWRIAEPEY